MDNFLEGYSDKFKRDVINRLNNDYYSLYFIGNNTEEFYGAGNKEYMCELINDYVMINDIYDKSEVIFRIKRGVPLCI